MFSKVSYNSARNVETRNIIFHEEFTQWVNILKIILHRKRPDLVSFPSHCLSLLVLVLWIVL